MSTNTKKLFTPIRVGPLELEHRVVLAPLTRLRAPNHIPDVELLTEYYAQRAQRPGTLLITEGTFPHLQAGGVTNAPGIWAKEQIENWRTIFKTIHDKKSHVFLQLGALGLVADPLVAKAEGWNIATPSESKLLGGGDVKMSSGGNSKEEVPPLTHALTKSEIKEYVQRFADAAKNAIEAGADGVEIHGATGLLLDGFLNPGTNQRTDEYGGSIENRARFPLEIVDAVSDAIGPERVGVRFSPWANVFNVHYENSPIPQFSYLADQLEIRKTQGKELAYIHIVEPRVNIFTEGEPRVPNELNDFIGQIWTGNIIRNGALAGIAVDFAEKHDDRTLIALGRYFISNPDIVDKLENGVQLTEYDRSTFYASGPKGYTDYPNGYRKA